MATKTETSLTNLVINYLSESDYNSAVSAGTINENEIYMTPTQATTDTKNTAGSTNTSSKIYLIGATSQAANPQTYSHDTAYVGTDGCLYSNSTKVSVDGHTHTYAGSSSAGGSATSAVKLDSSAGSATQPVYFSSGKPTACSYTLGKSVPSDAVFTDTTYTSLKNPYSLTIQGNGTTLTNGTYDGSAAKIVNITVSSLGLTASTTELNYCKGVTSAIQTQLNGTVKTSGDQTIAGDKTFSGTIRFTDSETAITPAIYTDYTDNLKISVGTSSSSELYWMGSDGNFSSATNGRFIGENNLSTYGVTGVKGNSESSYRKGNVNITVANLGLTATTTELNYCSGVTSNIQTQLDSHHHQNLHHPDFIAHSILTIGKDSNGYWFRPTDVSATGNVNLGSSTNPFNYVCANILRTYDTDTTSNGVYARVYNNRIYRHSSSSRRYKENIKPIEAEEIAPEKLYDAEVVQFTYKDGYLIDEDTRNNKLISGFIVEDLEKVYPIAIDYNDDGEPEMWNVNIIVPSMLKLIQDQKKKIDELETRIEALEA